MPRRQESERRAAKPRSRQERERGGRREPRSHVAGEGEPPRRQDARRGIFGDESERVARVPSRPSVPSVARCLTVVRHQPPSLLASWRLGGSLDRARRGRRGTGRCRVTWYQTPTSLGGFAAWRLSPISLAVWASSGPSWPSLPPWPRRAARGAPCGRRSASKAEGHTSLTLHASQFGLSREAAAAAVEDEDVGRVVPLRARQDRAEVSLDLLGLLLLRPAEALAQCADVRVDHDALGLVPQDAEDHVRRLAAHAGQLHELVHRLGHLAAVALDSARARPTIDFAFMRKKPRAAT